VVLSCTEPIDQLECFSTRQKHHAKTYVTGLVAGRNKTVQDISNNVLPAKSERTLNKFLTEYDWDENHLNRKRLELLQQANDTKWSSDGVVITPWRRSMSPPPTDCTCGKVNFCELIQSISIPPVRFLVPTRVTAVGQRD
jgi:hypothetical protein